MSYSQTDIDNLWWGQNGSAENPKPGSYVLMNQETVIYLTSRGSPGYDAAFSALLGYLYMQAVNRTGVGPTGADGFYSQSTSGGVKIFAHNNAEGWIGPTKS